MIENIICFAHSYTLTDANLIIGLLILVVIILVVMGCYNIRYNRIISQRNEQLRRILTALDNYRAIVGDGALPLDEQEAILKYKLKKTKEAQPLKKDGEQNFFVMMDARINKEKPYTDPAFDQDALIKFMGVSRETFCNLVPRYKDPDRSVERHSAIWCRAIRIPTERLIISTPYGLNTVHDSSLSIRMKKLSPSPRNVVLLAQTPSTAPSSSPWVSHLPNTATACLNYSRTNKAHSKKKRSGV